MNTNNSDFNNAYVDVLSEMYPNLDKDMLLQQVELEETMRAEGIIRQERIIEQAVEKGLESKTSYGMLLLRERVHTVSQEVETLLADVRAGRPGTARSNLRLIQTLDARIIAYIALKTIIDLIAAKPSLQYLALHMASVLEDEARYQQFREFAKKDFKYAIARAARSTTYHRKRNAMNTMIAHKARGDYDGQQHEELKWQEWSKQDKLGIGIRLVNLIIGCTGILETRLIAKEKTSSPQYHIFPTQAFKDWIKDVSTRNALLSPITLPCVIPPRDFTTPTGGGYYTTYLPPVRLLKTTDRAYMEQLSGSECIENMKKVYDAINIAQRTAWRINGSVLEVVEKLWNKDRTLGVLPSQEEEPLPRCPKCGRGLDEKKQQAGHTCFEDSEVFKLWKAQAVIVHERNAKAFSKRLQVHRILWVAEKMQPYRSIYFPYQLDFRGRLYAVPQFLNPQGCDLAKGLIEFAEAKPINSERAARWLAIHVANTWGEDKASFDERAQWVKEHEEMILNIARDPLEYTEWAQFTEGRPVSLSDLRGSGALEQLSDVVIALERNQQDEETSNIAQLRVLKNRPIGTVGVCGSVAYDHDTGRLEDTGGSEYFPPEETRKPAKAEEGEEDF